MIEGIELLIEEQVDIINMSMGDEYKYHKEIEEVCRAATEKGILIVAAYSNQQVEATYPASFPFVMGIRCLDIENPLQVFQYDGIGKDAVSYTHLLQVLIVTDHAFLFHFLPYSLIFS